MTRQIFQPMPDLTTEQFDALRADIVKNGILVPIVVDQHGRVLDGHNRQAIAADLGIDCPKSVQAVADDDDALDLAITLNCARRHLSREQVRAVVAGEIKRRPEDSDRAIARRVGCSPSTVGAVRHPLSNLDSEPKSRIEAEGRAVEIQDTLLNVRSHVGALVWMVLRSDAAPAEVVMALTTALRTFERRSEPLISQIFRDAVFIPLIDAVMLTGGDLATFNATYADDEFVPEKSDAARRQLLEAIADVSQPWDGQ